MKKIVFKRKIGRPGGGVDAFSAIKWKMLFIISLLTGQFSLNAQVTGVYAGKDWSVCPGQNLNLSLLGAQTYGIQGDVWWETNGDGTFTPSLMFNNATEYRFGAFDISKGEVTLTLFGRAYNPNGPVYTDQVRIVIAKNVYMACHDSITIPLNEFCQSLVLPQMLIEGVYPPTNIFSVEVRDTNNQIVPNNILTYEHLNQSLRSKVTNTCNNHFCESKIGVKDYYPPFFIGGSKDTVTCLVNLSPDTIGFPLDTAALDTMYYLGNNKYYLEGWDRCGSATLSYADSLFHFPCTNPFQSLLVRRWTGRDLNGNVSQTRDSIYVLRTSISHLQNLPNFNGIENPAFECGGDWPKLDSGYPSPDTTGYPNLFYCSDFDFTFSDQAFPSCGNTVSIFREWILMDWCNNDFIKFGQIIKIVDKTPPAVTCNMDSVVISTGYFKCTSDNHQIIFPVVWDGCGTVQVSVKVYIFTDPANPAVISQTGGFYFVRDLPVGKHRVVFTATDQCGNINTCGYDIIVVDNVEPYAICDENTIVSLTTDGNARLFAASIDDGSYDNCGLVSMEIAKMTDECNIPGNLQFGEYVDFCCAEAGKTVMVAFRITDLVGLQNSCMVNVTVQDKLPPLIICPPDLTISCDTYYDPQNLGAYFGQVVTDLNERENIIIYDDFNNGIVGQDGVAMDNCFVSVSHEAVLSIDNCNTGQINRTFTATDNNGLSRSCHQLIVVIDSDPFLGSDITWPRDTMMNGCFVLDAHPDVTGRPVFNDDFCSLVSASYTDQHFSIVGDACETVIRTWTVIDWCQHDPGTGTGEWSHIQTIKLLNSIGPTFTSDCQDREVCVYGQCEGLVELSMSAADDCTAAADLNWVWRLDRKDDGSFEHFGFANFFSMVLAEGIYRIEWSVEDKCGNISRCSYRFTVSDCKNPTPLCISSITTVIMNPDGKITINPLSFHLNSYDNCTPDDELKLSWSSDVNHKSDTITCDDMDGLTEKKFEFQLWVTDNAGNQDYCTVELIVQDNMDACGFDQGFMVSGTIFHAGSQKTFPNVPLWLESNFGEFNRYMETDNSGTFVFEEVSKGYDYTIKPQADPNTCSVGINTLDLIQIQRHILNVEMLNSPYRIIAADVNNSKSISGADILEIRNLILGVSNKFSKSNCWKFIPKTHQFSDIYTPWNFPENIFLPALSQDQINKDFYVIKMGDVNGSAATQMNADGQINTRSIKRIYAGHTAAMGDDKIKVPLYLEQDDYLMGIQFTAEVDGAFSILGIEGSVLNTDAGNYAIHEDGAAITFSWHHTDDLFVEQSRPLIYLIIRGKKERFSTDFLSISGNITDAKMISHFNLYELAQSQRSTGDLSGAHVLYQNKPNPFDQQTVIGFDLPEDMPIELTLYNAIGMEVYKINEFGKKGLNEILVDADMLKAPGVYQYHLRTKSGISTKKLIYLR